MDQTVPSTGVRLGGDPSGLRKQWLETASVELAPRQVLTEPGNLERLGSTCSVYVPALGEQFAEGSAAACRELAKRRFRPTPHLPARSLPSRAMLDAFLHQLRDCGVRDLLLIAGDRSVPAGEFCDTIDVLESGLLDAHEFRHIGVAGHPDGHPFADHNRLMDALRYKQEYGRVTGTQIQIVTQFVFSAAPLIAWMQDLRDANIALPVRVGLPGPAKLQTLLKFAMRCGVTTSAKVLSKRPDTLKLFGRWSANPIIDDLANHFVSEDPARIDGLHIFPFGGLAEFLDWRDPLLESFGSDAGHDRDRSTAPTENTGTDDLVEAICSGSL